MRRSFDDGESWEPTRIVLPDFFNATMQARVSLQDRAPSTHGVFDFYSS